jgi:phage recombination protein Bet
MVEKEKTEKKDEAMVKYVAADGQEVKLTLDICRKYLVQGHPEYVTPTEFMFFMHLSRSRGLNPFTKDCYLIKYTKGDNAAIVTSIDFFRKRAKAQPDCQGWNVGLIVQTKTGIMRKTHGFIKDDEILLGSWFEAKPKGWDVPFYKEFNLKGFIKYKTREQGETESRPTRFWSPENQPGQIMKVAESQGLRTLWPDQFGKMYTDAETGNGGDLPSDAGEIPEVEEEDAEVIKKFYASVPKNFDMAMVDKFVELSAKFAKTTADEIKMAAVRDLENFWKGFEAWNKKANGEKTPTAEVKPAGSTGKIVKCPEVGKEIDKASCLQCLYKEGCPAV